MMTTPLGDLYRRSYGRPEMTVRTFREYVNAVNPRYRWYRHCEILADALQQVADGHLKRLLVFMPPRHGKSEEISRLFSGYYLERHPGQWFGLTSYAAGLAFTLSRNARDNYQRAGHALSGSAGVEHWETGQGGGMWAAGVGGPITGKGAHVLAFDDPLKNAEEASSEIIRDKHKDWYRSTFYTRAEPDAAIIGVQTRWHEDDLSGWLLAQELEDDPEGWTILNLPAIAEEEPGKFPSTCRVAVDWRSPGEALCPERYPIDKLRKIERRVGGYYFGALYQQRPTALTGDIFKRDWWKYYTTPEMPIQGVPVLPQAFDRVVQSWDMAFKDEESSDFVSGQVWGTKNTNLYLLDRINERLNFTASCAAVQSMTGKWPQARAKYIEDKANGPAVISAMRGRISGLVPVRPDGGKVARAYAAQPMVEGGYVYLPHPRIAPWVEEFVRQHAQFPRGTHDDDVDACTQAINRLARSAKDRPTEDELGDPETGALDPDESRRIQAEHHDATRTLRGRRRAQKRRDRILDPNFGEF